MHDEPQLDCSPSTPARPVACDHMTPPRLAASRKFESNARPTLRRTTQPSFALRRGAGPRTCMTAWPAHRPRPFESKTFCARHEALKPRHCLAFALPELPREWFEGRMRGESAKSARAVG